ncbi:hypothetical protein C8R44DRAFT_880314 [Mycena epipterygia]|nr:hypothetical protein C8R44DRAFT_880314 [Mycena epipterygia]
MMPEKFEGRKEAQRLRQTRNTVCLAFCFNLPNEILAEIFKLVCTTSNARSTILKSVSHVCHLWRHVALGCGELWTHADYQYDHPEWVKAQLRRSANIPVVVQAHFPMQSSRGIQNLRLALKESAIHMLDIQAPPKILDEVWQKLDASSIRTLSLFIPYLDMPKSVPYPGPAFQLNAPQLKTLALSNFIVSWDGALFNNLTHLRLTLQSPAFAPSMNQILAMLASSPMLTELILLHAIENPSHLPSNSVAVVPLARVTTFLLHDDILNHIFLLRHIDIPAHCSLSLKVEHRSGNLALLTEMGRSIPRTALSPKELAKLYVEVEPSGVTVRGYTATKESVSVAGTLLCSLPLIATTALELTLRNPHAAVIPVARWKMCLQNLVAIESLKVTPTTPCTLFSALTVSTDGPVLLPLLQRLEIHHPDSDTNERRKPADHRGNWWERTEVAETTFFDKLLTFLTSRQQSKAEIRSLRIARCPPCSVQHLGPLKLLVKDVTWCGK